MSLPPQAAWTYQFTPKIGSPENKRNSSSEKASTGSEKYESHPRDRPKDLLLAQQFSCPVFDRLMISLTGTWIWAATFLAFLSWLSWQRGWKTGGWILLGLLISVLFADQLSASYLKPWMLDRGLPRGSAQLSYKPSDSSYRLRWRVGFPSSHASNAFAVATFLSRSIYMGRYFPYIHLRVGYFK